MTVAQQLFTIFFAVLYGAMLTSIGGLRAFPWGFPSEKNEKSRLFWRLSVAIICFNLLPFFIFAGGYSVLGKVVSSTIFYWHVLFIAVASLSVYGPYRLYHLLMVSLGKTNIGLYSKEEYKLVIGNRTIRESIVGHSIAFVIYMGTFLLLYCVK